MPILGRDGVRDEHAPQLGRVVLLGWGAVGAAWSPEGRRSQESRAGVGVIGQGHGPHVLDGLCVEVENDLCVPVQRGGDVDAKYLILFSRITGIRHLT